MNPIAFSSVEINGEKKLDAKGRQLYVPKALCLLSHQPMFSAFAIFLRYAFGLYSFVLICSELYRNAITVKEIEETEDQLAQIRRSSFSSKLRKGSTCNLADDSLVIACPGR